VFVPFHFGGDGTANLLTSDAVDPVSAMPEFKTGAVRVRRVERAVLA
jgi:assimilatory nitrate reductase catalytic subunit